MSKTRSEHSGSTHSNRSGKFNMNFIAFAASAAARTWNIQNTEGEHCEYIKVQRCDDTWNSVGGGSHTAPPPSHTSSSVAPGLPMAMFSKIVVAKSVGSCVYDRSGLRRKCEN